MTAKRDWPPWWKWELIFTGYAAGRMEERLCREVDVRRMMEYALDCDRSKREGRWVIETRLRRAPWKVIVEPDADEKNVVVVTVYPVDQTE